MFKFLVLGVFLLCAVVKDSFGLPPLVQWKEVPEILSPLKNDSDIELTKTQKNGQYNFYASHQTFYFGGPFGGFAGHGFSRELNTDYHVSKGIGAHKLHLRKLTWNRARRICTDEGGHLAVIATETEEKILLQMITNDVTEVWIGYHDLFEDGDWVSVLDEPLAKTGWARWSKKLGSSPSGRNGEHCAKLLKDGGMDDTNCNDKRAFICKVSTDE